jgi:hypothetical protein
MHKETSVLTAPAGRWRLAAAADSGWSFLGMDSEGTGRDQVNLLAAPARLEFDDPEETVRLAEDWVVFTPVTADQPGLDAAAVARLPERLELEGKALDRKLGRPANGVLDLAPLIGGALPGVGAYVFIPFTLARREALVLGFGADWWLQAWLDGREVCTTFPDGNRTFPPTAADFTQTLTLDPGEHLLAIRFISGAASARLCVSARRQVWTQTWEIGDGRWRCRRQNAVTGDTIVWEIAPVGDDLVWTVGYRGRGAVGGLRLVLPFNAMITPTVLLPAKLADGGMSFGPWLLVAPDFGHLRLEPAGDSAWQAAMAGKRGSGCGQPHAPVTPPTEREAPSREYVARLGYSPQKLELVFHLAAPVRDGDQAVLRLRPVELTRPEGIDPALWKRLRRPYLNQWQPSSNWSPRKDEWMLLGNNALSDVAPCVTFYYAEPMLFWHELTPGISVATLLRATVDHALHCHVARDGHCISFFDHETHFMANPAFIIAAWQYWRLSRDGTWLAAHLPVLHRIGEFLVRRDVDGDGLVESWNSGNAGNLREPDRADVYFEYMNFGWKNACTNAYIYKAWNCLAEMLETVGKAGGAAYYRTQAGKLRRAYAERFISREHGWFVSWISQDGEVHDYCHTFVNGLAVAYGLVPPEAGRTILERVVRQSHAIGFTAWDCGVPANLLPVRRADMMQPEITLDGTPNTSDPSHWPEDLTEAAAFGYRAPNGVISGMLTWLYLLGLQTAGLHEEADRILDAMLRRAEAGLFQNGVLNRGTAGAEFFLFDGRTTGYEGYLPEVWNFLMAAFTRTPETRRKLLPG